MPLRPKNIRAIMLKCWMNICRLRWMCFRTCFSIPHLDESELSKEKNVILEEISMYEDTPDDMVHDLMA